MKIMVTGAQGFIGKNLTWELRNRGFDNILEYTKSSSNIELRHFCEEADFVFHFAGVNRPMESKDFIEGNVNLTQKILDYLAESNNSCPIVLASTIQVDNDSLYGQSKKGAEQLIKQHSEKMNSSAIIFRIPNVFGKWSKPNYNSVIATFCHNIARDIPIEVHDEKTQLNLVYIDDLVDDFIRCLELDYRNSQVIFESVSKVHTRSLGEIAALIKSFKKIKTDNTVINMSDVFVKNLYSTYTSYIPVDKLSYTLDMHSDARGSFTEFLKFKGFGQVSINVLKSGVVKGNHWHHSKNEKFLVVRGEGVIRIRALDQIIVHEYFVNGDNLQVIDIPVGYTHNIENLGTEDMVTVMWVNEFFDHKKPDTYPLEV